MVMVLSLSRASDKMRCLEPKPALSKYTSLIIFCFSLIFYKSGGASLGYEYADKEFCRFYHPHQNHNEQEEGIYDLNKDLEFQIQPGSQLFPEYPCNSITQCFYHLRKALNLPMFHQHSLAVDFIQYRDRQFIFGFN